MTDYAYKIRIKKIDEEFNLFLNPIALIVLVMLTYVMNIGSLKA